MLPGGWYFQLVKRGCRKTQSQNTSNFYFHGVCVRCIPVSTPEAYIPSLCFVAFSKVALRSPGMPFPFSPLGAHAQSRAISMSAGGYPLSPPSKRLNQKTAEVQLSGSLSRVSSPLNAYLAKQTQTGPRYPNRRCVPRAPGGSPLENIRFP